MKFPLDQIQNIQIAREATVDNRALWSDKMTLTEYSSDDKRVIGLEWQPITINMN